jgi:CRP/FNR family transcriptional regulator, cyclic AMP receptor protein
MAAAGAHRSVGGEKGQRTSGQRGPQEPLAAEDPSTCDPPRASLSAAARTRSKVMAARPKVPKALDLKSIWLFSACTNSELRRIRSSLDEVQVPKGKVLVEEGRIGLEFFLIVEGRAVVTRNGRKVATLGPGGYFGELALLDRRPRSASVVSETDMDVLVLSQRQFNGLLESVPTISRKMLAAMANRLREADSKLYG